MKKQIFPIEVVENSTEQLIKKNSIKTHIIYNIVIISVVICVVLTFFIYIDINVATAGVIKTPGERIIVGSPYSAFVENIHVVENTQVGKGDTLLVLNSEQYDNELLKNKDRLREVNDYVSDLKKLVRVKKGESGYRPNLSTSLYRQSFNYYISQSVDLNTRVENIVNNYNRTKKLLEYGDISPSEFEPIEAEYNNVSFAIDLFFDRQINEWQSDLDRYLIERRDLLLQIDQLEVKKSESVIVSPVEGIIQKIQGVNSSSYVQQGQQLFEISPKSDLLVECMILPSDIGYIKVGQSVRMQVDAFNYNEWGFAEGKVVEVFEDVSIVSTQNGNASYFRVMCSLDTPTLRLKNGYEGELKRGMSVNARFNITRRTIFQLLYDKVDDWMNPNNPKT